MERVFKEKKRGIGRHFSYQESIYIGYIRAICHISLAKQLPTDQMCLNYFSSASVKSCLLLIHYFVCFVSRQVQ